MTDAFGERLSQLKDNGRTILLRQRLAEQEELRREYSLLTQEVELRRKKWLSKELPIEAVEEVQKRLNAVSAGMNRDIRQELMNSLSGEARELQLELNYEISAMGPVLTLAEKSVRELQDKIADINGKKNVASHDDLIAELERRLKGAQKISSALYRIRQELESRSNRLKQWILTGQVVPRHEVSSAA